VEIHFFSPAAAAHKIQINDKTTTRKKKQSFGEVNADDGPKGSQELRS